MPLKTTIPHWLQHEKIFSARATHPHWLNALSEQYYQQHLQQTWPTYKEEAWKYTPLSLLEKDHFDLATYCPDAVSLPDLMPYRLKHKNSILIVFVNGYLIPHLSDLQQLPAEILFTYLNHADFSLTDTKYHIKKYWPDHLQNPLYKQNVFITYNAATTMDGIFLHLPDDCELTSPIHLLSIATGTQHFVSHPHHVISIGKNAKLTLLEEYLSLTDKPYMMNTFMHLTLDKDAQLDHYKIQNDNEQAIHMAHTLVKQKQNSIANFIQLTLGGIFSRDNLNIELAEQGACCNTHGLYYLRYDQQYTDHHIAIEHAAPHSNSEMLYKGIIDKKSRAVFNGRVHVHQQAQKIIAHQTNHHILLSKEAEAYAKPELEIYADDVKCKHGATTGQIDQEALFYLCARGISRTEAMKLLLQGFAEDIWQRIKHPAIQSLMRERLA